MKMSFFLRLLHKMRKSYPQSSFFIGGQPVFVHIYSKTTEFFIHSKCINGFFPQKYPLFDKQKGEYLSTIKTQVWITLLVFFGYSNVSHVLFHTYKQRKTENTPRKTIAFRGAHFAQIVQNSIYV